MVGWNEASWANYTETNWSARMTFVSGDLRRALQLTDSQPLQKEVRLSEWAGLEPGDPSLSKQVLYPAELPLYNPIGIGRVRTAVKSYPVRRINSK